MTALDSFVIRGLSHNIPFLSAVLDRPRFKEGSLTTDFINQEYPDGFQAAAMTRAVQEVLVSVAALAHMGKHQYGIQ